MTCSGLAQHAWDSAEAAEASLLWVSRCRFLEQVVEAGVASSQERMWLCDNHERVLRGGWYVTAPHMAATPC